MIYLQYRPECSLYSRTRGKSATWYVNYRLPNGIRMRRSLGKNAKEAKRLAKIKESQLKQGIFDEKDLVKMEQKPSSDPMKQRLKLNEAWELYLETTKNIRTPRAQYNDTLALRCMFAWIEKHRKHTYFDEVTPLDCQLLFNALLQKGKSASTLQTYSRTLSKVFKWFIEDMELLDMKNPTKKILLPRSQKTVRDRLPTDSELESLLNVERSGGSKSWTPIQDIVAFLAFTGARLGEVLHAEWRDFDLDQGIWRIHHKPDCPTKYGLGWSPKWHKEREILLFPEALEILRKQPQHKTFGCIPIRDESNVIIGKEKHPAQFIFPKLQVSVKNGKRKELYTRVDDVGKAWDTLKRNAGVTNLQLKDLRTYLNHLLKTRFMFSGKEAGAYLGNSEEVNNKHYTPVSDISIQMKMSQFCLKEATGIKLGKVLS